MTMKGKLSHKLLFYDMNFSQTEKCPLKVSLQKRLPRKNAKNRRVHVDLRSTCEKKGV